MRYALLLHVDPEVARRTTDEEAQVLDIAARLPVAAHGAVEVRPLMTLPRT